MIGFARNNSTNGRSAHPKHRFEEYVERRWGMDAGELSPDDRQLAIADWSAEELSARLNGSRRTVPERMVDLGAKGGPWGVAISLIVYLVERGSQGP